VSSLLDAAAIPAELKALDQWLVWKYVQKPGKKKKDKVPCFPDGRGMDVTKPENWLSFEQAQAALNSFDGLGLALRDGDDLVGWDFDACLDERGEIADKLVAGAVNELNSYTEVSPSGSGLRVMCRGPLPHNAKQPRFEVYRKERYLTLTGNALPGFPSSVERRDVEVPAVFRRLFGEAKPEAAQDVPPPALRPGGLEAALQDARARALYETGDLSDYGGDASAADFALCCRLVLYGSNEEADGWFRASKLMRPKWDERRGQGTWGSYTLGNARKAATKDEPEQPSRSWTLAQLRAFADALPDEPGFLAGRVLAPRTLAMIYGKGGIGKTTLALWLGRCIALGQDFGPMKTKEGTVLFLSCELSEDEMAPLVKDLFSAEEAQQVGDRMVVRCHPEIGRPTKPEEIPRFIESLLAVIEKDGPRDVIFLDALADLHGLDENSNAQMGALLRAIRNEIARRLGSAMSVLHHAGKESETRFGTDLGRGASVFRDVAAAVITLEWQRPREEDGPRDVRLRKGRRRTPGQPTAFSFEIVSSETGGLRLEFGQAGPASKKERRESSTKKIEELTKPVKAFVKKNGPCSGRAVSEGVTGRTEFIYAALGLLADRGELEELEAGWVAPIRVEDM